MVWMVMWPEEEPHAMNLVVEDLDNMLPMLLMDSEEPFCMKCPGRWKEKEDCFWQLLKSTERTTSKYLLVGRPLGLGPGLGSP